MIVPVSCLILTDLYIFYFYISSLFAAVSSAVAPDTINNHVKTCQEEQKNFHFFAPEYGGKHDQNETLQLFLLILIFTGSCLTSSVIVLYVKHFSLSRIWHFLLFSLLVAVDDVTTAVDIYSFGMCALEVRWDPETLQTDVSPSSKQYINVCVGVVQMALLEIQGNGESSYVSQEAINNAIQSLEDPLQRVSYS